MMYAWIRRPAARTEREQNEKVAEGRNNCCSLQKLHNGKWIPAAARYRTIGKQQQVELDCGLTVESGGEILRRFDFEERLAIFVALRFATPQPKERLP